MTRALQEIQADHIDYRGRKLVVDGILGPITRWALALDELPPVPREAVKAALRALHAGVREAPWGANHGPEIDGYLRLCGLPPGHPWCAAFVSWCAVRAGSTLAPTASVAKLVDRLLVKNAPAVGLVGYWLRDDGTGHCGIVTLVDGDLIGMVEGNSGDAVRFRVRHASELDFGALPGRAGCVGSLPRLSATDVVPTGNDVAATR
jgi:hypothetical protein